MSLGPGRGGSGRSLPSPASWPPARGCRMPDRLGPVSTSRGSSRDPLGRLRPRRLAAGRPPSTGPPSRPLSSAPAECPVAALAATGSQAPLGGSGEPRMGGRGPRGPPYGQRSPSTDNNRQQHTPSDQAFVCLSVMSVCSTCVAPPSSLFSLPLSSSEKLSSTLVYTKLFRADIADKQTNSWSEGVCCCLLLSVLAPSWAGDRPRSPPLSTGSHRQWRSGIRSPQHST